MGLKALAAAAQKEREEQSGRGAKAGGGLAALHRAAQSERDVTALPVFQSNVTPLPSFQTAPVQAAGGRSGLKTGVNRGALTQEAHRSATAGKGDVRARALERASSTPVWDVEPTPAAQGGGAWDVTPDFTAGRSGAGTPEPAGKQAGFGTWLLHNAEAGLSGFNKSLMSTLDFFLPTDFLGKYDPISKLNDMYASDAEYYARQAAETNDQMGGAWKAAGDYVVQPTVNALPNAVLALMSAGGSIAAQGASTVGQAAAQASGGLGTAISAATQQLARNPSFWSSMLQTTGPSYERAKADGAGELEATAAALITGFLNSAVEVGGGIETLPKEVVNGGESAVRSWVRSMIDEGKEEVVQGAIENLTAKAIYAQTRPWLSTSDENAVINPVRAGQEFAGGAVVGGLLGGVQTGALHLANRFSNQFETLPNFRQAQASVDTQGQNVASDGAVEATGQNKTASTGETGYNRMEADAIRHEGKTFRNLVAGIDSSVSAFFEKWRGGRKNQQGEKLEKLYLGRMSESVKQQVSAILGYSIDGRDFIVTNDDVKHIMDEHGDPDTEVRKGNLPLDTWALDSLQDIVANPDSIIPGHMGEGKKNAGKMGVVFTKTFPNGRVVCIQFDNKGRGTMEVATMYVKKGNTTSEMNADKAAPIRTSETPEPVFPNTPIIAENSVEGNTQSAQGGKKYTDDGVGAANAGFAGAYHQLQNQTGEGGFHPDGEKAARQVDVPKKDFDGRNIPKSAATVLEAEATPDSAVDVIQEAIAKGEFSFDTITDEAALKRARTTVEEKGWDGAMEQFHQAAASGTVNKDNTALGQVLLNNAMNVGNSRAVIDLLSDYSTMSTTAAQALQANRMLKKLSPEGQLYAVQRSLSSYQEELRRRMGDKAPEITVEPALYQEFLDAQDQTGREAALEAIYKDVAGQVPANWMDKWNAWRYLAMLGNPRTHIRNIVGNAAFAPVRMVKNAIGTALEAGVDYLSPQGIQRTKAALNPASSTDRGLVKAALADVANVEAQLLGEGKYSESAPGKIRDYQSIFALEPLEALRKFNGTAMDVEDTWFSKPAYAGALAGYLKANGVDAQALNDGTVDARLMDQARAYAIREAQRATYRDSNAFSEFVSGLRRKGNSPVDRAVNVLMEGVLPFRKTPANILMRGVEYSPAGLVKGLTYDLRQVQQGKMEAAQAIDDIAAGLTGTGLLALGAWLASMGLVSGGGSGDDEQDGMDDLAGGQDYALSVGGKNYTLDWLAPEALPFFVGVELFNTLTDKSEGGVSWKNIEAAANRIMDPMLEMSMLQGLQDAIDNVRYADGGTLPKVAANAALSYLAQGVPTLFGQIERTLEDKRYTTYVDRTSGLPTDLQYTLGRTANKLPGEFQQVPYIDAWGRQEGSGSTAERAFNNFFNPAYVSRESETAAEREIKRLLDAGQSGVAPQRTSQSTQVTYQEAGSGETHKRYLTAEEYVDYASVKGQTSFELVSAMMESEIYKSMTDEQKADAIKLAYTYANHVASEEVTDGRHVSEAYVELAQAAKKELGLSEAEYLLLYKEYGGSLVNGDKVREAYRQGMEAEEYLEYAAGAKGYNEEARRPGVGTDGPERGGETEGPRSGPVSSPRRREADPAASVPERDNEDEKGNLTIAENAKAITQSGLSKGNQEIAWALAYPEWPEKAEEAGLSMAEYIQYKTATYGCKKKAEKLAALREAGLPVGWYYKVELCKAHVP